MNENEFESTTLPSPHQTLLRDALIGGAAWMGCMLLLLLSEAERELLLFWTLLLPSGLLFYGFAVNTLIPNCLRKSHPLRSYLLRSVGVLLVLLIPVWVAGLLLSRSEDEAAEFGFLVTICHLLVTVPLAWVISQRRRRAHAELYGLKTELGQSTATLDFLRSQINPHFLFNALNTLYGTALQENSERTAHGIQLLGDMMRFMLHENHQPKILLSREIEYLRNYIELQSLRTATSSTVAIQTTIDEVVDEQFIAPMLLIPFVENAFKHGISLQEPSWIRITLHCTQNALYFDVYNSTHTKREQGVEKENAGIGLDNVRQRLALLYPERHELVIRETVEEYFVHLTLQL
ncbi:sensor histidine kinase [Hymenobacter jejuensis]|nr:histidine kinase [Hymenobacter jejuensis]